MEQSAGRLAVVEAIALAGHGLATPVYIVVDSVSLRVVLGMDDWTTNALRARLGNRAGVGIAAVDRDCARRRDLPCERLKILRDEQHRGVAHIRAVWLPPQRDGQRCVSSYEASFEFMVTANGTANLIRIYDEDYGDCGGVTPSVSLTQHYSIIPLLLPRNCTTFSESPSRRTT